MSDQPWTDARPSIPDDRPHLSAVVDGDEVRELVARNEQQIAHLHHELAMAQREAEEAELRLSEHPSALWLDALPDALAVTPEAPLVGTPSGPAPVLPTTPVATNGRTVVDRRPSRAERSGPDAPAPTMPGSSAGPSHRRKSRARRQPSGRARLGPRSLLSTGWLWKAGVVVVVGALVLLKLG
jgi:hypothetical protein